MLSSKVASSPPTNVVKYSRFPFSNLLNATLKSPANNRPFSTKLHKVFNFNSNSYNVRDIGKKLQRSNFPKFRRENRINSLNFTVLGSGMVKFYSGHYRTYNKSCNFLLSAVFVSAYNRDESDNETISENPEDHFSDLEFVRRLTEKTLVCKSCHLRIRVDHKLPNVKYCKCSDGKALETNVGGWKPFIERPSGLVWRKEHESYRGLYAYKMYGRLEDVSALDFLRVQLDTGFRKRWDTSASELLVIEENSQLNYDIIYWEMQWPKPFAKRDYVFLRKLAYEPKENICIISSVATSHPSFPPKRTSHRVKEYWSYMAIHPLDDFKKPGLEFVVTYFDNPGLSIPSSMSSWVAMTALPNFVSNLHNATLKVSELEGPEPTLLRYLLQQLDAKNNVVDIQIDEEESIVQQLDPPPLSEEVQVTLESTTPAGDGQSEEKNPFPPNEDLTLESTSLVQNTPLEIKNPSLPDEGVAVEHTSQTEEIQRKEDITQQSAAVREKRITEDLVLRNFSESSASSVSTRRNSTADGETPAQLPQDDCASKEVEMQLKCNETDDISAPPPPPPDERGTDQNIAGS